MAHLQAHDYFPGAHVIYRVLSAALIICSADVNAAESSNGKAVGDTSSIDGALAETQSLSRHSALRSRFPVHQP